MDTNAHLAEQGQSPFSTKSPIPTNVADQTSNACGGNSWGRSLPGWPYSIRDFMQSVLHVRWNRKPQDSPDDHVSDLAEAPENLIVRSLNDNIFGYPNLATFADSDESFSLYRRFGYLQSRLLLDKQEELRLLEGQLDDMDRSEGDLDGLITREGQGQPRKELLARIELRFRSYASLLSTAHNLMSFNRPSQREYQSVLNYMFNVAPIHDTESKYIYCEEDLVTLRPGREVAWLDRSLKKALRPLRGPLVRYLFCSKENQKKASNEGIYHLCKYRMKRFSVAIAAAILAMVILFLLIVPIYLLFHLAGGPQDTISPHANAICIGILLSFTLLFSAAMTLFTSARKHEVLGAAVAYCAVLVVFLGNVSNLSASRGSKG
ncbi:hypothetical protein LTR10_008253 [Elasticomyces elasticus]|nr:hypothetical protein LTR10_008253 [Elasticomyces elasticus]KAK4967129.1 hypothetical protein LTR42_010477 [Elasticomyces elasticus]